MLSRLSNVKDDAYKAVCFELSVISSNYKKQRDQCGDSVVEMTKWCRNYLNDNAYKSMQMSMTTWTTIGN